MEDKKIISVVEYKNATKIKLKNRRITVIDLKDDIYIESKILSEKENANTRRSSHESIKDKIVVTGIRFSPEAAFSIMYGIQQQLKKKGFKI